MNEKELNELVQKMSKDDILKIQRYACDIDDFRMYGAGDGAWYSDMRDIAHSAQAVLERLDVPIDLHRDCTLTTPYGKDFIQDLYEACPIV